VLSAWYCRLTVAMSARCYRQYPRPSGISSAKY